MCLSESLGTGTRDNAVNHIFADRAAACQASTQPSRAHCEPCVELWPSMRGSLLALYEGLVVFKVHTCGLLAGGAAAPALTAT